MKRKDKNVEQIELKRKHRESLKEKRRSEPNLERKAPTITEYPTILIVCEGRNTEPSYFRQFRLSSATIEPIGEGFNTISLVKRAIELSSGKSYEQVWCVFDADPKPDNPTHAKKFNDAIQLAKDNGLYIAYSNQAFEYWIILHFEDHQGGGMHRKGYNKKINSLLKAFGLEYDGTGSKIITEKIFELLEGVDLKTNKSRKYLAIDRAKRNYDQFDHTNPASEESSTTVFKLVEELLKYV